MAFIIKNFLELETIDNVSKCIYPFKAKFIITHKTMWKFQLEMTQITLWRLIPESIKQSFIALYWKILNKLRFWGFFTTAEACVLSWKDFTLKFWKYKLG